MKLPNRAYKDIPHRPKEDLVFLPHPSKRRVNLVLSNQPLINLCCREKYLIPMYIPTSHSPQLHSGPV